MRAYIKIFFLLVLFNRSYAQFIEKKGLVFNDNEFDICVVALDSFSIDGFAIIENKSRISEATYFSQLENSIGGPFVAITASIIDSNCNSLGFLKSEGRIIRSINLGQGTGNFYLKPNGVAALNRKNGLTIQESQSFRDDQMITEGVQSGPMLLVNGQINSVFDPNSKNKFKRCGIGVFNKGGKTHIVFASSVVAVSFYQFAQLFIEKFNCDNALTLESGSNSSMHLPTIADSFNNEAKVCRYIIIKL